VGTTDVEPVSKNSYHIGDHGVVARCRLHPVYYLSGTDGNLGAWHIDNMLRMNGIKCENGVLGSSVGLSTILSNAAAWEEGDKLTKL
jgi:hypothetical protein